MRFTYYTTTKKEEEEKYENNYVINLHFLSFSLVFSADIMIRKSITDRH